MISPVPFDPTSMTGGLLDLHRQTEILPELDAACLEEGRLKAMPASFYAGWSQNDLTLWCVRRGFYCLPTLELVEFIRDEIDCDSALEIGAGNGALGRAVGIDMTDSYMQERPEVRVRYEQLNQEAIKYGDDVEKLTALEAVEKYKPNVVVAAWVTHRWDRNRPQQDGNMYGVDEGRMLDKKCVRKYVFVGHERIHSKKPILSRRHAIYRLPFLYSRALDARNAVYVWTRGRP